MSNAVGRALSRSPGSAALAGTGKAPAHPHRRCRGRLCPSWTQSRVPGPPEVGTPGADRAECGLPRGRTAQGTGPLAVGRIGDGWPVPVDTIRPEHRTEIGTGVPAKTENVGIRRTKITRGGPSRTDS